MKHKDTTPYTKK